MADKYPIALSLTSPKTGEPLRFAGQFHTSPHLLVLPDAEAASFAEHFDGVSVLHSDGTPYEIRGASAVGLTDEAVIPAPAA